MHRDARITGFAGQQGSGATRPGSTGRRRNVAFVAGLEETSYHLALRALEERLLSELRTRTGTLITAA
jgi:hypothetical protein